MSNLSTKLNTVTAVNSFTTHAWHNNVNDGCTAKCLEKIPVSVGLLIVPTLVPTRTCFSRSEYQQQVLPLTAFEIQGEDTSNSGSRLDIVTNDDINNVAIGELSIQADDETEEKLLVDNPKAIKNAAKKLAKQQKRLKREGKSDASIGQRPCYICKNSVDFLIRCRVDASQDWKMVCNKCWPCVSGGVTDGDANHPYYRYGGVWKNK